MHGICIVCVLTLGVIFSSWLLGCVGAICLHAIVRCRENAPQPVMYSGSSHADCPSGRRFICTVARGCADDWPLRSGPSHGSAVGIASAPEACTGKMHSQNLREACYGCIPGAAWQTNGIRTRLSTTDCCDTSNTDLRPRDTSQVAPNGTTASFISPVLPEAAQGELKW